MIWSVLLLLRAVPRLVVGVARDARDVRRLMLDVREDLRRDMARTAKRDLW